jgi:hypothetical protein
MSPSPSSSSSWRRGGGKEGAEPAGTECDDDIEALARWRLYGEVVIFIYYLTFDPANFKEAVAKRRREVGCG